VHLLAFRGKNGGGGTAAECSLFLGQAVFWSFFNGKFHYSFADIISWIQEERTSRIGSVCLVFFVSFWTQAQINTYSLLSSFLLVADCFIFELANNK
jgi:diacylglycerol kinase